MTEEEVIVTEAPDLISTGTQAMVENANRLGLTWQLRPATVITVISPTLVMATYDGDTVPIGMVNLTAPLLVGARVMAMAVPPSGNFIIGHSASNPQAGIIAIAQRTTSSTPASGAQGVLRLDNVKIYAGRDYMFRTSSLAVFSTVAGDTGAIRFTYELGGTTATTGSTVYGIWNTSAIATTANGTGAIINVRFTSTTTTTLSLLLITQRVSGTGNISIFAGGTLPCQIMVEDLGPTVTDTGTSI